MSDNLIATEGGIKVAADVLAADVSPDVSPIDTLPDVVAKAMTPDEKAAVEKLASNPPAPSKRKRNTTPAPTPVAHVPTMLASQAIYLALVNGTPEDLRALAKGIESLAKTRAKGQTGNKGNLKAALGVVNETWADYEGDIIRFVCGLPQNVIKVFPQKVQAAIATIKTSTDASAQVLDQVRVAISSITTPFVMDSVKPGASGMELGKRTSARANLSPSNGVTSADFPSPMHVKGITHKGKSIMPKDTLISTPDGLVSWLTNHAWQANYGDIKVKHPTAPPSRGIRGTLGSSTKKEVWWQGGKPSSKVIVAKLYGQVYDVTIV